MVEDFISYNNLSQLPPPSPGLVFNRNLIDNEDQTEESQIITDTKEDVFRNFESNDSGQKHFMSFDNQSQSARNSSNFDLYESCNASFAQLNNMVEGLLRGIENYINIIRLAMAKLQDDDDGNNEMGVEDFNHNMLNSEYFYVGNNMDPNHSVNFGVSHGNENLGLIEGNESNFIEGFDFNSMNKKISKKELQNDAQNRASLTIGFEQILKMMVIEDPR